VLDLYAGTGALGLEALSRGAARVTLVESAAGAIAAIRQNISALGVEKCARLIAGDVARAERRLARDGPFDLVVADPPWSLVESGDAPRTLAEVLGTRLMTSEAWLVLEHSARIAAPGIGRLVRFETRHYGDAALTFYKPAILGPPRTDVRAGPPSD
jgi:16S rRNA (guanine(966)-N(2))-methyltransferase RsmD